jgi:serine/threonine-protein kinase
MDGPGGFQKWVAIKRIHRHLAEDERFVRMFLDEARVAARISHPNVAQVFELGSDGNSYWIAMEYLHGEPLRELVRVYRSGTARTMHPHLAAKVVSEAAEGLHAAHELRDARGSRLGLVHRDVSPHNIFLTYDGAVKVVDFGIAKAAGRLASTRAGTLKGKLAYMSPEQVRGEVVDRRTDVFALGIVLWELVTGRRLFQGKSEVDTVARVQSCRVPHPSRIVSGFPVELESILGRALARDRGHRFRTARELSRALQRYLQLHGAFLGYEEVGDHLRRVMAERHEAREALLLWAALGTASHPTDRGLVRCGASRALSTSAPTQEQVTSPTPGAAPRRQLPPQRSPCRASWMRPAGADEPVNADDAVTHIMFRPAGGLPAGACARARAVPPGRRAPSPAVRAPPHGSVSSRPQPSTSKSRHRRGAVAAAARSPFLRWLAAATTIVATALLVIAVV